MKISSTLFFGCISFLFLFFPSFPSLALELQHSNSGPAPIGLGTAGPWGRLGREGGSRCCPWGVQSRGCLSGYRLGTRSHARVPARVRRQAVSQRQFQRFRSALWSRRARLGLKFSNFLSPISCITALSLIVRSVKVRCTIPAENRFAH